MKKQENAYYPKKASLNAHVQRPEGLFRKELNPIRCAGANARFWESSRFPRSEAGQSHQWGREATVQANHAARRERSVRLGPAKSASIHVGLEQGTNQRYISPSPAIRPSSQSDV